jgi:microcystin degradation protein MlrC
MSLYDCRQISSYPTTLPLMRGFVDRIKQLEDHRRILSVSIVHCFPYADVPELGSRVLVVSNGDKAAADGLARQLGEELVSMRVRRLRTTLGLRRASRRHSRSTMRRSSSPIRPTTPAAGRHPTTRRSCAT